MFRKKFIVIISAVALLAAFLIWAIFFAPRATVVITAKTSTESLSKAVALSETKGTSFDAGVVRMIRQEEKKAESVDFEATGEENKGEKATGVVRFSTGTFAGLGTIPAGTQLTSSSGLVYVTDSSVTLVAPGVGGTVSSATVSVTAAENGAEYNAANGNLRGAPSGVSAIFTDATSGGTDKLVKVVTAADVQKASQELSEKEDSGAKNRLTSAFGDRVRVIESSFTTKKSAAKSSPAVGQEASGSARLSTEITYSVVGIAESELKAYFEAAAADLIADQPSQRIYDDGAKNAKVGEPETEGDAIRAQLSTEVKIGPEIKDDEVKEKVKGKRFGDIQADISIIQGVSDVDVKFWPFWVRTVPNNTDRITIEFKVDE